MFSLNAIDELLKKHEKTLKEELQKATPLPQNPPKKQPLKSVFQESHLNRKTKNDRRQKHETTSKRKGQNIQEVCANSQREKVGGHFARRVAGERLPDLRVQHWRRSDLRPLV